MAFSIEALQSKSKLNNVRARQFVKDNLWPEMMPREEETLFQSTGHQLKQAILGLLDKIKLAVGSQDQGKAKQEEAAAFEAGVVVAEEVNDEGFIEVHSTANDK